MGGVFHAQTGEEDEMLMKPRCNRMTHKSYESNGGNDHNQHQLLVENMVGNNKNWKLPVNSSTGDIAFKDGDDENGKISSRLQKSKLTLIINANV